MESTLDIQAHAGTLSLRRRIDSGTLLAWLLPGSLVTYLGLRGGGFDQIINGQVAIAVWWLIFLIAAFRLARPATSRVGWAWLGLLFAYGAWTTLSLIWTQSAENTMIDVSLMALYCGVAALAVSIRGAHVARHMLHALGLAISAIAVVALLSRLHFAWFAPPQTAAFLQGSTRKLSYPLNYWNALAALMAIGIPVLAYSATGARSLLARSLAAAAIPLLALTAFLTVSRGGVIAVVIGVVVFVLFAPERFTKLLVIGAAGAGSALLIDAANQRPAVRDGLRTALAAHQGSELIATAVAVAIGVALLVAAITLLERHWLRVPLLTRRTTTMLGVAGLLACLLAFVVAGGPGFVSREWNQFKTPAGPSSLSQANALDRLANVTGNGRYQYWQSAAMAATANPLTGTGAGTFVYWWAAHGTLSGGYVRDAHSLYMQALGELGYPGLILIASVVALILIAGVIRAIRGRDPARRLALAAALAGATVFAFSASVEWIWLIPVLPVTLIVLAVVIFSRGEQPDGVATPTDAVAAASPRAPRARLAAQIAVAICALVVMVAVALPMSATGAVRDSQSLAAQGELAPALTQAIDAANLQPYAASPWLQEALVLERAGDLPDALVAASHATAHEPTNWQTWFVLFRLEARTGHARAAIADYEHARSLDPRNPIFTR